jgi:hypothetical protein
VDVLSKDEKDGREIEVLEPPPAPVVVLVSEDEKEVAPPMTPCLEDGELMDISDDIKGEMESLEEFDALDLSFEESRELARARGKRVRYWDEERRTDKRIRVEPMPSPEQPSEELDRFCFLCGRGLEPTGRTGGFYEPDLSRG